MQLVFYVLIGLLAVLLIVGLTIASYAGNHLIEKFEQTEKYMSSSFMTSKDFAITTSINFFNKNLKVGKRDGFLSDAYSSSKKAVFLSERVYDSSSVAALTITAHELGHALQDKKNPTTLKRHKSLIIAGKFFGYLMMPCIVAGVLMFFLIPDDLLYSLSFLLGAVGIFSLALFLKLMTISIEKDASKNAIMLLKEQGALNDEEIVLAKKLLKAALLTYIADFLRIILSWTFLTKKTKLFF